MATQHSMSEEVRAVLTRCTGPCAQLPGGRQPATHVLTVMMRSEPYQIRPAAQGETPRYCEACATWQAEANNDKAQRLLRDRHARRDYGPRRSR